MSKKGLLFFVIVLIFVILGVVFYLWPEKKEIIKDIPEEISKEEQKSVPRTLIGEITQFKQDALVIKIEKIDYIPSFDKEYELLTVSIDNATEFKRNTEDKKDIAQYNKEMDEYRERFKTLKEQGSDLSRIEVPSRYISREIKLIDLSVGDDVTIESFQKGGDLSAKKVTIELKKPETVIENTNNLSETREIKISGTIAEIRENMIKIIRNGPAGHVEELIEIELSTNLKIIKKSVKSNEQFNQEMAEYREKISGLSDEAVDKVPTPGWYSAQKEVGIDELSNNLTIKTSGVENIKTGNIIAEIIEYIE